MKKKIIFMGSSEIALPVLSFLKQPNSYYELIGVFSKPDKPSGRGKHLNSNIISQWASSNNIKLFKVEKINQQEINWLKEQHIDLIITMAYGNILKKEILRIPTIGCFNLHTSLLPSYRGPSPIIAAIADRQTKIGVTLIEMNEKIDQGEIIDQESMSINYEDSLTNIEHKMSHLSLFLLKKNLFLLIKKQFSKIKQDEKLTTYTRKIIKEDGFIDFSLTSDEILYRHKALQPWPGSFFYYKSMFLKVGELIVSEVFFKELKPGTIIESTKNKIIIQTANKSISIIKIQKSGGKMLLVEDFLRGFYLESGVKLDYKKSQKLSSLCSFNIKKNL